MQKKQLETFAEKRKIYNIEFDLSALFHAAQPPALTPLQNA